MMILTSLQPGDGLVWFGDTAHFAYGGNRRVVSTKVIMKMTMIMVSTKVIIKMMMIMMSTKVFMKMTMIRAILKEIRG